MSRPLLLFQHLLKQCNRYVVSQEWGIELSRSIHFTEVQYCHQHISQPSYLDAVDTFRETVAYTFPWYKNTWTNHTEQLCPGTLYRWYSNTIKNKYNVQLDVKHTALHLTFSHRCSEPKKLPGEQSKHTIYSAATSESVAQTSFPK